MLKKWTVFGFRLGGTIKQSRNCGWAFIASNLSYKKALLEVSILIFLGILLTSYEKCIICIKNAYQMKARIPYNFPRNSFLM